MSDPVVPFDLLRLFLGDGDVAYLGEILFRTVFIYVYTLVLLRWIGGRSVAQLSLIEFLLVIALGSAVGDALFYPEVPLLHAMTAITVVVLINKSIDMAIARSQAVTELIDGQPEELIKDGRILQDGLGNRHLGVSEVMSQLRIKGIRNLGEVEAAYLESAGEISVFKANPPRPGLAIVPPIQITPRAVTEDLRQMAAVCCENCGGVHAGPELPDELTCPDCRGTRWTLPTLTCRSTDD